MNKNVQCHIQDFNSSMFNREQQFMVRIEDRDVSKSTFFEPMMVVGGPRSEK